jgi:hypothetical protein
MLAGPSASVTLCLNIQHPVLTYCISAALWHYVVLFMQQAAISTNMWFHIFAEVYTVTKGFWFMTLCIHPSSYKCFEGTCWFHVKGISTIPTLKLETESLFETLDVNWCHNTEYHNPDVIFEFRLSTFVHLFRIEARYSSQMWLKLKSNHRKTGDDRNVPVLWHQVKIKVKV